MRQVFHVTVNGQQKFEGHNGKQAKNTYNDFERQARPRGRQRPSRRQDPADLRQRGRWPELRRPVRSFG